MWNLSHFNPLPFGYFAKNDLTNQQQTMNPEDELFLLRWNHIKLPSSVLQPPAGVGGPWHPLGYERIFLCRFSYDAASSRTSIHSAEMQLVPHADGGNGLTWSPCQQVELKCCAKTFNRTHAHKRKQRTPSHQGQLATSLIITLLTLPAGIENATPLLRWCVGNENEEHLDASQAPESI